MSQVEAKVAPNTYGNLTVLRHSGLFGLKAGPTIIALILILFMIVLIAQQKLLEAGLLFLVGGSVAAVGLIPGRQGRNLYGRLQLRLGQFMKEKKKQHLYIAGPTGAGTPDGAFRLPGLMARSELTEQQDSYGRPFGLIRVSGRGVHHYSVVIEAQPDGESLVDHDEVENRVAKWAAWLSECSMDDSIRGASVTIESAPDSGLRLERLLDSHGRDDAPAFAKEVVNEIRDNYRTGAPELTGRITITFDGRRLDGKAGDRGTVEMAEEIGNKLPGILAGLGGTGAGGVMLCTAQQITDNTRVAYDPTTAATVEELQESGGTGLVWEEAGPSFSVDEFDLYRHDRAVSRSWTMYEGPRGMFTSNCLRRLMEPSTEALRKRVTLLYRPIPVDRATAVVDREQRDSTFAGSQTRVSQRAQIRRAAAQKSAQEEALGAGLTRFGLIVTITVRDQDELARWDKTIPGLVSGARLRMRPALGNQAVTFQAGLPLGVVLPDHMVVRTGLQGFF